MNSSTDNKAFDRVLIIMFENMYRGYVMQNPYMRELAKLGTDMANYHGVMHPSQTNYISSIAGELCNISNDERPEQLLPQDTIVDLIEAKCLHWKAYMQGYCPDSTVWSPDMIPQDNFPYLIKHNPFSSFANIVRNKQRWQRVVSADQLLVDAANNQLPEYAWFTPDMWNDGHYSAGTRSSPAERAPDLVDQQAIWLRYFFGMLKFPGPDSILPDGTLVIVTYDEADFEADYDPSDQVKYYYDGPNQIYTILLGSMVRPGVESEGYNHYSLIRSIEKNFDLETLGKNDQCANWFQFLWNRHFGWEDSKPTPFLTKGPIAFACPLGVPTLAFRDNDKKLCVARFDNAMWSNPEVIGDPSEDTFALAVANGALYLVTGSADGVQQRSYTASTGWSPPSSIIASGPVRSLALASFDEQRLLMLAFINEAGELYSLIHSNGAWAADTVSIGAESEAAFATQGSICLAVLGSSIFCIYEAMKTDALMVVSYNCAAFNVITATKSEYSGPYNNTTVNLWSPSAFPVEAFTHAPNPKTPGEPEPVIEKFAACAPLACATLDGVIHLAHATPQSNQLVTETLSISGLLTPKLPVSYNSSDEKTTNNGYGTLAQAGWTEQISIGDATLGAGRAMAMASDGQKPWLANSDPSGVVVVRTGGYRPMGSWNKETAPLN